MNCAGEEIGNDLFQNQADKTPTANVDPHKVTRSPYETTGGSTMPSAAEIRKKEEEEARRKKEEEEEAQRIAAEEEARLAKEKERKEKSILHKSIRFFKKFVNDTLTEE